MYTTFWTNTIRYYWMTHHYLLGKNIQWFHDFRSVVSLRFSFPEFWVPWIEKNLYQFSLRILIFNGLVQGKIYRKPWFLPSNIGLSCKFSHHPILWDLYDILLSTITGGSRWKFSTSSDPAPKTAMASKGRAWTAKVGCRAVSQGRLSRYWCEECVKNMWRICEEYVNKPFLMTLNDIKWLKCGLQYAF